MKWLIVLSLLSYSMVLVVAQDPILRKTLNGYGKSPVEFRNVARPHHVVEYYDIDYESASSKSEEPTPEELNFLEAIYNSPAFKEFLARYLDSESAAYEVSKNETEIVKVSPEDGELNGSPEHKSLLGKLIKKVTGHKSHKNKNKCPKGRKGKKCRKCKHHWENGKCKRHGISGLIHSGTKIITQAAKNKLKKIKNKIQKLQDKMDRYHQKQKEKAEHLRKHEPYDDSDDESSEDYENDKRELAALKKSSDNQDFDDDDADDDSDDNYGKQQVPGKKTPVANEDDDAEDDFDDDSGKKQVPGKKAPVADEDDDGDDSDDDDDDAPATKIRAKRSAIWIDCRHDSDCPKGQKCVWIAQNRGYCA